MTDNKNMWSNYTTKETTPVDNDELMIYDSERKNNKKLLFGGFWKWIAKKLKEAELADLETSDKTIIGALNTLNKDSIKNVYLSGDGDAIQIIKDNWNSLPQGMSINLYLSTNTVKCIAYGYIYGYRFGMFFIISVSNGMNGWLKRGGDAYTWYPLTSLIN